MSVNEFVFVACALAFVIFAIDAVGRWFSLWRELWRRR